MSNTVRSEQHYTVEEFAYLTACAKEHSLPLATFIRYAVMQHCKYVAEFKKRSAEEYLKYQVRGEKLDRLQLDKEVQQ